MLHDFVQGHELIDMSPLGAELSTSGHQPLVFDEARAVADGVYARVQGGLTLLRVDAGGVALCNMQTRVLGQVTFQANDFIL